MAHHGAFSFQSIGRAQPDDVEAIGQVHHWLGILAALRLRKNPLLLGDLSIRLCHQRDHSPKLGELADTTVLVLVVEPFRLFAHGPDEPFDGMIEGLVRGHVLQGIALGEQLGMRDHDLGQVSRDQVIGYLEQVSGDDPLYGLLDQIPDGHLAGHSLHDPSLDPMLELRTIHVDFLPAGASGTLHQIGNAIHRSAPPRGGDRFRVVPTGRSVNRS